MTNTSRSVALFYVLTATAVGHAQQPGAEDDAGPLEQVVPVADEAPATEVEESTETVDDSVDAEQRLMLEFERYRRLIDEGAMDEADTSAKRIVEMVIRLYGPQSIEASKALNNLALVQNKNGQHEAAIQNFESAVQIIEVSEDRLNAELVNPLKGLGAAQLSSGRPDLAARTFNRATHITHVNEGPHNIEQVEILESLAETTLRLGDMKGARKVLDRIHILNVRHFDNNELGLLPSLMRRADWQHRAGYYNDERATYRRAIRIVETRLGKNNPQLILPLTKLGESFYFVELNPTGGQQQGLVATGEMYFKRAAKIAEKSDEIGWREHVDIQLALGDYYVYAEAHNRARKIFREVWSLLSTDEERLNLRRELLEQPALILHEPLPEYVSQVSNPGNEAFLTGTIRVDYTVSKRGRVRDLRTESIPPDFTNMQRAVHREIRKRLFRPMLVDAQPRKSGVIEFEHTFYYRQADLDKAKQQNQQATQR